MKKPFLLIILLPFLYFFILNPFFSNKEGNEIDNLKVSITHEPSNTENIFNQYSSSHADFAEWLRRVDKDEDIEKGDIVAVKAGQITKNLTHAEQIMVVSHQPGFLGNRPSKSLTRKGHAVAFMGQVLVHVVGTVNSGDYIVAKKDNSGHGKAVSPSKMSVEDYTLAVGRAWESSLDGGLKKVNTVIGVDNSVYLNLLEGYEQKIGKLEKRLKKLESKIKNL